MASPERGVLNRGQGKCGQSSLGGTHPPRARQAPPGHCCLPAPMEKGSGSASAWLGGELPPPPGAPVGPTLYACRTPPLSAMFSPSVLNPFTCTSEMGWQDSLGPLPGTPRGQGLCCLLRSAFLPGPKSSSPRGRPCTLTASRSAGLSACSTSRACCCPCRSSGLVGAEAAAPQHQASLHVHPGTQYQEPQFVSRKQALVGLTWVSMLPQWLRLGEREVRWSSTPSQG